MEKRRLRDPIHDLIVFDLDKGDGFDRIAWQLINSKELQRLRRIKQLGFSELVFPGATHSRFAHSVGVYNNARQLMKVLERETGIVDKDRERVILAAALLHDIGHGPFSHAFENAREAVARQRGNGPIKNHEVFSAALIRSPDSSISKILGTDLANQVARLIESDDPIDMYHAVISSSFDADRLDYVMRDRYMTGVGAGAIDQDWLIDNLTTQTVVVQQDDEPRDIQTFVFKLKGRQAAEDFLLARYRLYSQVYLHKTTRGFEQLASALLKYVGSEEVDSAKLGVQANHPLMKFLRTPEFDPEPGLDGARLQLFLRLDDMTIWSFIEQISHSDDRYASRLATKLMWREAMKVIDISAELGHDREVLLNAEARLDAHTKDQLGLTVFKDRAPLNLYSRIGGEMSKEHKKVRVLDGSGKAREITWFGETIISERLTQKDVLVRYFFFTEEERAKARKVMVGG
jgi:uncharacterized protein